MYDKIEDKIMYIIEDFFEKTQIQWYSYKYNYNAIEKGSGDILW